MIAVPSCSRPDVSSPRAAILLVDDEPHVLAALRRVLRGTGADIEMAGGAARALELLATREFLLVVTDLTMPGMDGLELAQQIRERWPRVSVALLTAHRGTAVGEAMRAGVLAAAFDKPWDDTFIAYVEQTLRGGSN